MIRYSGGMTDTSLPETIGAYAISREIGRGGMGVVYLGHDSNLDRPVAIEDRTIERNGRSTPVRLYTPANGDSFPLILLIHGGAWVAGSLDTHDNLARYLSKNAVAVVVSVGYENSPEGKFPGVLEQCYDALLWAVENAGVIHADAQRLAVAGDSAGGNMTAALCLITRDRLGPKIDFQALINPVTDMTGGGTLEPQGDALDRGRWYASMYISDPEDANHPYVSPIVAADLSGLPPALVVLAEHDSLRDQGQRYADRLLDANVPTNVYCQMGIGHLAGDGARASIDAQESLDVVVAALRGAFRREGR
jgi:acetyl esterase